MAFEPGLAQMIHSSLKQAAENQQARGEPIGIAGIAKPAHIPGSNGTSCDTGTACTQLRRSTGRQTTTGRRQCWWPRSPDR